jgi:hypothetical protein
MLLGWHSLQLLKVFTSPHPSSLSKTDQILNFNPSQPCKVFGKEGVKKNLKPSTQISFVFT